MTAIRFRTRPAPPGAPTEEVKNYNRIHVSGISGSFQASDLEQLFSKVCNVEEVYIPEPDCLGFSRGFAVVRVGADKTKAQQCIKNFNGAMWKGSKLRLAFAKEWYKERIDREKQEDQDHLEKLRVAEKEKETKINQLMARYKIPAWSSNMLRIRKARTLPKIRVCSQPKVILGNDVFYSKAANAICKPYNKKIIFDADCFPEAVKNESFISESEFKQKLIAKAASKTAAEAAKTATSVPSSATGKPSSATVAVPSSTTPKAGGKGRQGFGTLMSVPVPKCIEEKVDCCIDEEEELKNRNSKNRRRATVDEHDDFAENSFEIVYPNDDTPCMTAEELEESVLQAERQRVINMAMSMYQEIEEKAKNRKEPVPRVKETKQSIEAKKAEKAAAHAAKENTAESNTIQEDAVIAESQNAYINMSTFKNIFQKEEGVWWNDNEEKVSGSTHIRGKLENDILFQEAEKLGFEVRQSTGLSVFKAGDEAAAPAAEKTVLFNFFGEPDPVAEKMKTTDAATSTSAAVLDRKRKAAVVVEIKPVEKDIDLVFEDIISLAKRFCREKPFEEIENNWKKNKDELIQEFKKKRRDAKRWALQEKVRRKNVGGKHSKKERK